MLHEPLSAVDPRSVTRWGRPQGGVAPPSFDANGQDLDPTAALKTSFQLLSSGERLDTAHAGRARLATLATTEQQVSQRRARRLWKACAFVLARHPLCLARFLPVSQYLLERAFGVWVLKCGVLTSFEA